MPRSRTRSSDREPSGLMSRRVTPPPLSSVMSTRGRWRTDIPHLPAQPDDGEVQIDRTVFDLRRSDAGCCASVGAYPETN